MADTNNPADKPVFDAELPEEEEPQDAGFEGEETEEEAADREAVEASDAAAASGGRRFGFGRGHRTEGELERHDVAIGSVRESHERVHIDDRPSAIYALICAAALIGVLGAAWLSGVLPQGAVKTLAPLVVPTSQATASPSVGPSVSVAPSASGSVAPSTSPKAS